MAVSYHQIASFRRVVVVALGVVTAALAAPQFVVAQDPVIDRVDGSTCVLVKMLQSLSSANS